MERGGASSRETVARAWHANRLVQIAMQGIGKRFVYVLRSESAPNRSYVGVTSDVENRLEWHNSGPDGHTRQHRPWKPVVVIEFGSETTALRFERYLKTGSGRAFAKRHFGGEKA